jgi:hypothetical protein
MPAMKIEACVRCGRAVKTAENINESGEPCVVAYTVLRTSGVRPMVRASARRRIVCMPCGISIGLGPSPNNGAFNEDIYEGCVELATKNPSLAGVALEQKINPPSRPRLMPGSKPDDTLGPNQIKEPLAS